MIKNINIKQTNNDEKKEEVAPSETKNLEQDKQVINEVPLGNGNETK